MVRSRSLQHRLKFISLVSVEIEDAGCLSSQSCRGLSPFGLAPLTT